MFRSHSCILLLCVLLWLRVASNVLGLALRNADHERAVTEYMSVVGPFTIPSTWCNDNSVILRVRWQGLWFEGVAEPTLPTTSNILVHLVNEQLQVEKPNEIHS